MIWNEEKHNLYVYFSTFNYVINLFHKEFRELIWLFMTRDFEQGLLT